MKIFNDILGLWKAPSLDEEQGVLAVRFSDLTAMRRFVPYLKDFNFNQTAVQSGNAKSSFKGRGIEFEEVRSYNFGDDVRDIDWRVTARKNEPYTKLYAEEKDREVVVWLDLSTHMRFGTKKELKSVSASKVAALLGWFTLFNKDRFKIAIFDGFKTHFFEAGRNQERLLAIFKKIEEISQKTLYASDDELSIEKSLQTLGQRLLSRSIIFLIGSFDEHNQSIKRQISLIAHRSELYLINIFDTLEAVAPPKGQYLAKYRNQEQILDSTGDAFSQQYAAYFAKKRFDLKKFCARFNCQYREVRTDLPLYSQLKPI